MSEVGTKETKLVYVKRWRTLVELPAKYADEIVESLRSSADSAVEGKRDAIVQLIHKHIGVRQRVNVDLTGVEDAADAILRNLNVPQSASEDWKQKYETEHARLVRLNEKYDNSLKSGASEEPTDEGIAEAIRQTEYKYFGDYELSDGQWGAVYLLVNAAKHLIKRRSQAEIAK